MLLKYKKFIFDVYFLIKTYVMDTKLTLNIEENVIKKAKKYAKKTGRSLSDIIENYLKIVTDKEENENITISPFVAKLKGSFKAPKDFDYKKIITEELIKKHL